MLLAASLEAGSEHPLAQAFTDAAKQQELVLDIVEGFEAVAGQGIKGEIGGKHLLLGNKSLMDQAGVQLEADALETSDRMAENAWTPMFLASNNQVIAIIAVADPIKPESAAAIRRLQAGGRLPATLRATEAAARPRRRPRRPDRVA